MGNNSEYWYEISYDDLGVSIDDIDAFLDDMESYDDISDDEEFDYDEEY